MKRCFRAILTFFDRFAVEFAEILKGPEGIVTFRATNSAFNVL